MFSNHWQAQIDDIQIDVEIYTVGFGSAGCALFVNNERVDSVPVFGSITQLSLRHNTTTKNKNFSIVVLDKQNMFGTKASLHINGSDSPLHKFN